MAFVERVFFTKYISARYRVCYVAITIIPKDLYFISFSADSG